MEFECLVAGSATEALALAKELLPNAVVLDVGLPDHSGLWVLDQLKRDTRTRHIPVHVVSATDNAQTALSLGAIGYLLKPVKREDLTEVLKKLETKLAQRMRRVLIVEDDAVQRDAVRSLLGSHEVETVSRRHGRGVPRFFSRTRLLTAWSSTFRFPTPPDIRFSKP